MNYGYKNINMYFQNYEGESWVGYATFSFETVVIHF